MLEAFAIYDCFVYDCLNYKSLGSCTRKESIPYLGAIIFWIPRFGALPELNEAKHRSPICFWLITYFKGFAAVIITPSSSCVSLYLFKTLSKASKYVRRLRIPDLGTLLPPGVLKNAVLDLICCLISALLYIIYFCSCMSTSLSIIWFRSTY